MSASDANNTKPQRVKRERPLGRWARNKDTAEYLGISEMTLWRWKRDPKLKFPCPSVINGVERNDLDDVDAWLKSRKVNRCVRKGREAHAA